MKRRFHIASQTRQEIPFADWLSVSREEVITHAIEIDRTHKDALTPGAEGAATEAQRTPSWRSVLVAKSGVQDGEEVLRGRVREGEHQSGCGLKFSAEVGRYLDATLENRVDPALDLFSLELHPPTRPEGITTLRAWGRSDSQTASTVGVG